LAGTKISLERLIVSGAVNLVRAVKCSQLTSSVISFVTNVDWCSDPSGLVRERESRERRATNCVRLRLVHYRPPATRCRAHALSFPCVTWSSRFRPGQIFVANRR